MLERDASARGCVRAKTRQCIAVVPGEPRGGLLGHGALVTHELRQVVEGVLALDLGRVDERCPCGKGA